jgi:excisionase family DNA binding protein
LEADDVCVRASPIKCSFHILTALYSLTGLLTVEEAAEMFGNSPYTIYRMVRKREIPSFKFGGSRSFDPSELALWWVQKNPRLAATARYFQMAA